MSLCFLARGLRLAILDVSLPVSVKMETYLNLCIVFMCFLKGGFQKARKMPVTNSNKRPGPVARYSDEAGPPQSRKGSISP